MRQYLAEGIAGAIPFRRDTSKPIVQETRADGKNVWRIPGRLSECDKVNGNNRRYSRAVWESNMKPESRLMSLIKNNEAWGLLEHPKDGIVNLESPISHSTVSAVLKEDGTVEGEIAIIDYGEMSPGRKLKALIEQGYNPMVSSRGFGSLVKGTDGVDDVQNDYVCEGWDVVKQPSFETAQLTPDRTALDVVLGKTESKAAAKEGKVTETIEGENAKINLENKVEAPPATAPLAPAAVAAVAQPKNITESMTNTSEIKTRIAALKGQKPANATQFAEGLSQMAELHQQVANYVAEDAKRNWEGTKLHNEIQAVENAWAETQALPVKSVAKLKEDRVKVLHVCKNIVETALKYKGALAEALKVTAAKDSLVEELTTNGTGWMELANKRKDQRDFVQKKYQTACEALKIMAARYKEDMAVVGGRVLALEFKDKLAASPELQTALAEAKDPQAILALREKLEGKKVEAPAAAAPAAAAAAPAATTESKPAPAAAAPVTEAVKPAVQVVESEVARNPRSIAESMAMVQRLSLASK